MRLLQVPFVPVHRHQPLLTPPRHQHGRGRRPQWDGGGCLHRLLTAHLRHEREASSKACLHENQFYYYSVPIMLTHCRCVDIDALLGVIDSARQFLFVAVMDYFPAYLYSERQHFWPVIDDRIRRGVFSTRTFNIKYSLVIILTNHIAAAIERNVQVRLLLSDWEHSR